MLTRAAAWFWPPPALTHHQAGARLLVDRGKPFSCTTDSVRAMHNRRLQGLSSLRIMAASGPQFMKRCKGYELLSPETVNILDGEQLK
jgi:hypothetical protein